MVIANLDRIQRAVIDNSGSGTVTLIAASGSKRIVVLGMILTTSVATTWEFKSSAATFTGPMTLSALTLDITALGDRTFPWFVCGAGTEFQVVLGASVQLSGVVYYIQE